MGYSRGHLCEQGVPRALVYKMPLGKETFTCYSEYYGNTYTAEEKPTEDEKVARVKAEEEEKRVRHMKELWKLDRKFGKNRNGTRMIR